jgi:hypothetical protein
MFHHQAVMLDKKLLSALWHLWLHLHQKAL